MISPSASFPRRKHIVSLFQKLPWNQAAAKRKLCLNQMKHMRHENQRWKHARIAYGKTCNWQLELDTDLIFLVFCLKSFEQKTKKTSTANSKTGKLLDFCQTCFFVSCFFVVVCNCLQLCTVSLMLHGTFPQWGFLVII